MKNREVIAIAIIALTAFFLPMLERQSVPAAAQTATQTNYFWQDSIAIGTTRNDSNYTTYTNRWEEITFWFSGCNGMVKIGAPDTTDFATRKWLLLNAGQAVTVGPATRLRRIWFKAQSGTGAFFMVGYKRVAQY